MKDSRPVIWLGYATWYGGAASNKCAFDNRGEAIRWTKSQARVFGGVDFKTWKPDDRAYPRDTNRDDTTLDPTFLVAWKEQGGGKASVQRMEVCSRFDWSAYPEDAVPVRGGSR